MINVFQIQLDDRKYDEVNAAGWDGVAWGKAYNAATFKGKEEDVIACVDYGLVEPTMLIDTNDLDEAFAIGNCMGDRNKIKWEKTKDERSAHKSISVGDLLVDLDGNGYLVAQFGFTPVDKGVVKGIVEAIA